MNHFVSFFCALVWIIFAGGAAMASTNYKEAYLAGGCFWCMEPAFDNMDGVVSTISGYIGGHTDNPTYQDISTGTTGHAEAIKIIYDPQKVTFEQLLDVFWLNIDPLVKNRQFCDVGDQYRSAIFYRNEEELAIAQASKQAIESQPKFEGKTIYTSLEQATTFYDAEEYHQDYYLKNPIRYKFYRNGCGRDQRLKEIWG